MDLPTSEHRVRVRVFVDFWNFQLSLNQDGSRFRPDWKILGNLLAHEALQKIDKTARLVYQGMNAYGENEPDLKLRKWAVNTLARMTGVQVECYRDSESAAARRVRRAITWSQPALLAVPTCAVPKKKALTPTLRRP